MTFFTGTRRHRVQIAHFFRMQIGSQTASGMGPRSGSRLRRMRRFLELFGELWIETWRTWPGDKCVAERIASYVSTDGSARVCGVGARPRFISTLGGPRETSGPQIDRIPPARPPWWRRQYRELKKLFFAAPSKCPIGLFGPVANGTILKQLHVSRPSASTR